MGGQLGIGSRCARSQAPSGRVGDWVPAMGRHGDVEDWVPAMDILITSPCRPTGYQAHSAYTYVRARARAHTHTQPSARACHLHSSIMQPRHGIKDREAGGGGWGADADEHLRGLG